MYDFSQNQLNNKESSETLPQEYRAILNELNGARQKLKIETDKNLEHLQAEISRVEIVLSLSQNRLDDINTTVNAASSELVRQAMAQVEEMQQRMKIKEEEFLTRFRSSLEETVTDLAEQINLESLKKLLQESDRLLAQIQDEKKQLQLEITSAIDRLQDLLIKDSGVQNKVIQVEEMRSEVRMIAQQISLDKEEIKNRLIEFERLHDRLMGGKDSELKVKLKNLEKKYQYMRTWLLGISLIGMGSLVALFLTLSKLK
jgi:AraC-like DNA-binding protein